MMIYNFFILFIALCVYMRSEFKKLNDDIYYIKNRVYDIEERLKERGFKLPSEKDL